MEKIKKLIIITGIMLFIVDIAYLNYNALFKEEKKIIADNKTISASILKKDSIKSVDNTASVVMDSCFPFSCVDLIRKATASVSLQTTLISPSTSGQISTAKEYYVTFGSGQTLSDQYEDVAGLQAYIDSTKYGKIKKVVFEVTMRIPTANGRMYVQLFNATDQHPVWFSEVSSEGTVSQLIASSPITLDSGNKLYKVQAKTSLRYASLIDQARVHIITE